jgi:dephospho-CoA kinase
MSRHEAQQRMANQSSQTEKVKRAHRVIDNDGDTEKLYEQLDRIWSEISSPNSERV